MALQLENALNNLHFGGSWFQATECGPIVYDETGSDHVWASVDGSCTEGHLQQVWQFVKLFDCGLWVHEAAVVADHAVSSHKHVVGDWVSENFDAESVGDDFFGLLIKIGVDESDVIVAGDTVAKGREFLFDSDDFDIFGQAVPDVSEFVVGGVTGDKETFFIT